MEAAVFGAEMGLPHAREPDEHAWVQFYLTNRKALGTYALALTGNPSDAQDLLQDVLVKVLRERRAVHDARPYVMRCLRNAAIDGRRRSGVRPTPAALEGDGLAFIDTGGPTDPDAVDEVRSALAGLPEHHREVVVLKVYAELSFRQIAEILDIPLGTAASHYRRGLQELRASLAPEVQNV